MPTRRFFASVSLTQWRVDVNHAAGAQLCRTHWTPHKRCLIGTRERSHYILMLRALKPGAAKWFLRWANAFHSIMTHCGPGLTILQPGKNNCHIGTLHTTLTDSLLLLLPPPLYTVVNNEHVFFSSFYTLLALWLSVKRVLFLDAKVTIEIWRRMYEYGTVL